MSARFHSFQLSVTAILFAATVAFGATAAAQETVTDKLPKPVAQLIKKYRIKPSQVSLIVREMNGASPLLAMNDKVSRNPASVIKLLTTMAALDLLTPGYLWETKYLGDGKIRRRTLRGDLILQGGGDPFLTVERMLGDVLALRQTLDRITGKLVIDNTRFAPPPHNPSAFDEMPERLYNVAPDAALVNFSATTFHIVPRDKKIYVHADPPLAGMRVISKIKAASGKCVNRNSGWSYQLSRDSNGAPVVRFRGKYRTQCGAHFFARSLMPNNEYTYRLFTGLWRAFGGKISNGYRVQAAPDSAFTLHLRESASLAEIVTGINKFSNNVMSRQLLLTLAAEQHGTPGIVPLGIRTLRSWLADANIKMPGLVIENGSGLSRVSRMTATGLSALLDYAWRSTYRPEFVSSLPLAAIDGTMRSRLPDSPLRGRARIKTGLVDGVRSMAGYVHARDGRHYGVVMFIDSGKVNFWNGNEMQDAMLQWVYNR